MHYAAIVSVESENIVKVNSWILPISRLYTIFLVCSGVKMHIFNHKNNINWYAYIWSPALKMTRKRLFVSGAIHCENAIWNIQISAFNLYELKYLPGPFWKICSTHPQNFRDVKGKSKKKAWLYVKFCVSYQLVLQIYKESETEPKF